MRDGLFLSLKSEPATVDDIAVGNDLLDTLRYYHENCVGMAANMIGVRKAIIAFYDERNNDYCLMFNPIMIEKKEEYKTEEGCLCLSGLRKTTRYRKITVDYQDASFKKKRRTLSGFTAQIVQHELNHLDGILI